jgi:hypothetical protein
MGGLLGGKKKAPPPPPAPVAQPTVVTRAQQLAASRLRSRGGGTGSRSLIGGTTLGPTEEIVNQDQSNTLG